MYSFFGEKKFYELAAFFLNVSYQEKNLLNFRAMAVGALLNQYYRGLAYRCGRPSTLATFLYFSVFISALCDWLIFKEPPSILSIIGSTLIILAGVLKIFLRAHILKKKTKK